MLLVIMTRSLIRLDSIIRASLNDDCMTNSHDDRRGRARTETDRDSHDEERNENDARTNARTNANDDDITKGYNERE